MFGKQKKEKRQFLVYFTVPNGKGNCEMTTDKKITLETIHKIKEKIVKDYGCDYESVIIENIMELK